MLCAELFFQGGAAASFHCSCAHSHWGKRACNTGGNTGVVRRACASHTLRTWCATVRWTVGPTSVGQCNKAGSTSAGRWGASHGSTSRLLLVRYLLNLLNRGRYAVRLIFRGAQRTLPTRRRGHGRRCHGTHLRHRWGWLSFPLEHRLYATKLNFYLPGLFLLVCKNLFGHQLEHRLYASKPSLHLARHVLVAAESLSRHWLDHPLNATKRILDLDGVCF
mmetsp:Transcript_102566/g.188110  ORF Transcript_102566/g.188110 Transcript_102566/m.188110 type:complete len:220 (-) Transcript_102566:607-1266(-)